MSITVTLRKAAKLQRQIEALRNQMMRLLDQAHAELGRSTKEPASNTPRRAVKYAKPAPGGRAKNAKVQEAKASGKRKPGRPGKAGKSLRVAEKPRGAKRRRSPLLGVKRASSPSGPLSQAVIQVLRGKSKPMNVRDIYAGLTATGYKFTAAEPKKNLAARVYRLKGVKQVGTGMFALA